MNEHDYVRTRKSVTRTIRIDEEVDRSLADLAYKEKSSVNNLVNNALRRYVEWDYLSTKYGFTSNFVPASKKQMDYLSDQEVIELGEYVGRNLYKEFVMFFFKSQDLDSTLKSIRLLGHSGNFQCEEYVNGTDSTLICKHGCGRKWSLYYETLFKCVFEGLDSVGAKIESTEDQVLIRLKVSKRTFLDSLYGNSEGSISLTH